MATKKVLWPWWRQPVGKDLPPDLYSREGRQRTQDWIEASRAREQLDIAAKTTNASHQDLPSPEFHKMSEDNSAELSRRAQATEATANKPTMGEQAREGILSVALPRRPDHPLFMRGWIVGDTRTLEAGPASKAEK